MLPEPAVARPHTVPPATTSFDPSLFTPAPATRPPRRAGAFWIVLVVALGGAGAALWFGLRENDRQTADPSATPTAPTDPPDGAPASRPTVVATIAPAPPVTTPRYVVGAPLPEAPPPPPFEGDHLGFWLRLYDDAGADSGFIDHDVAYDPTQDIGSAISSRPGELVTLVFTDAEYRYTALPDGTYERVPRSPASLAGEPDVWMARALGRVDAVPTSALPFTTLTTYEDVSIESGQLVAIGLRLDVARFAEAEPVDFASWLARWSTYDPRDASLVDEAGRQVREQPADRNDKPIEPLDLSDVEIDMQGQGAVISLLVKPDGVLKQALILDTVNEFRTWYLRDDELVRVSSSERPGDVWIDAPG